MKKAKLVIGIILVVVGLYGLTTVPTSDQKITSIVTAIVVLGIGALLLYLYFEPKNKPTSRSVPKSQIPQVPDGEKDYCVLGDTLGRAYKRYSYEENMYTHDFDISCVANQGGKEIKFVPEPKNEYDEKAIAIYLGENKIGYVNKGLVQDMIHDYTKKRWKFVGHINKYSISDRRITYKIGFYVPFDQFEERSFSLKKITGDRKDNISTLDEGDGISVDYESVDDCFIVYNDAYEDIGVAPKSEGKYLEECEDIVGYVDSVEYDDENNVVGADVVVYLIK